MVTNSALYAAKWQREGSRTWNVWINDRNNNRVEDAGRNMLGRIFNAQTELVDPDVSRLAILLLPLCGISVDMSLPRKSILFAHDLDNSIDAR